jgi:hypothetical protein
MNDKSESAFDLRWRYEELRRAARELADAAERVAAVSKRQADVGEALWGLLRDRREAVRKLLQE